MCSASDFNKTAHSNSGWAQRQLQHGDDRNFGLEKCASICLKKKVQLKAKYINIYIYRKHI